MHIDPSYINLLPSWIWMLFTTLTIFALISQGIVPAASPFGNELTFVTRRAFIKQLVVQLYKATPTIAAFIDGAQMATGGVDSVNVPVQGSAYVSAQWTDYSGTFTGPQGLVGTSLASYDLAMLVVPIPFLGTEALLQMDHSIIPLIEARFNDAQNVIRDTLATALHTNSTVISQVLGFPAAIDDGTNVVTYGGISRSANAFWKSFYVNNSPAVDPTRALLMQYLSALQKTTGEMPTMLIGNFGTWTKLAIEFLGLERYNITPSSGFEIARAGFRAIDVAGVPFYADPYVPEGTIWLINTRYINLYIHDQAAFTFTGFESLLPNNQLGYIGVVLAVLQLVCTKPATQGQVKGLNSLPI